MYDHDDGSRGWIDDAVSRGQEIASLEARLRELKGESPPTPAPKVDERDPKQAAREAYDAAVAKGLPSDQARTEYVRALSAATVEKQKAEQARRVAAEQAGAEDVLKQAKAAIGRVSEVLGE